VAFLAEGEKAMTKCRKASLSPSELYFRIIEDVSEVYRSQSAFFGRICPMSMPQGYFGTLLQKEKG
jgi:hypothetical protein